MRIPARKSGKETSWVPEFPTLLCNFGSITAGSSEERKWQLSSISPAWQTRPAKLPPGTGLLDGAAILRNSHLLIDGWMGCELPHWQRTFPFLRPPFRLPFFHPWVSSDESFRGLYVQWRLLSASDSPGHGGASAWLWKGRKKGTYLI